MSLKGMAGVGVQELGKTGPEDLHRPGDGCQICTTTPLHSAFDNSTSNQTTANADYR